MTDLTRDHSVEHHDSTHPEADEHQRAIEACEHAIDVLRTGEPARTQALLEEALATVEHARSTEVGIQTQRETAWTATTNRAIPPTSISSIPISANTEVRSAPEAATSA